MTAQGLIETAVTLLFLAAVLGLALVVLLAVAAARAAALYDRERR